MRDIGLEPRRRAILRDVTGHPVLGPQGAIAREELEPRPVREVGQDIREARALNEQMRGCIDAMDPAKFTATNQRFHKILYSRCPNRHLLNMVIREWQLLNATRKSAFAFIPERAIGSVAEHEQLLQLVESGSSAEEIEAFARRHRMKTARSLLQHIGNEMSDDLTIAEPAP